MPYAPSLKNEVGRKHLRDALLAVKTLTFHLGYAPTMREVGVEIGVRSSSDVHGILTVLKEQGYVDWETGSPRTLRVTERGREALL